MRLFVAPPLLFLFSSGCFFFPDVESHGYTSCSDDAECAAGRSCAAGLCAPPRWSDERFAQRRLLIVENESQAPLPPGAALPVRIGAEGLLETAALGVDGRFSYFSLKEDAWRDVPVWRDVYGDHLYVWLPVQEQVPPQSEAALAWVETRTGEREPNLTEDAARTFPVFFNGLDGPDGEPLPDEVWRTFGTPSPLVGDGAVLVGDNQKLVARKQLTPPFSLTAKGRINGVNCEEVYVGVTAGDGVSYAAPSVGFWMDDGLTAQLEVAPQEVSVPQQPPDLDSVELDTATHRFRIDVGDRNVRWAIDDEVVGEPQALRFLGEELYFRVEVGGACSFELDAVWVTPLPFVQPTVRAEPVVEYRIFD